MSKFYPFNSAAEVAKNTFYTEDEIVKLSQSESEYGLARFRAAIDCAVGCKEFGDALNTGGDLPGYRPENNIDISKTWATASKQERGVRPYAGLTRLLK